MDALAPIQSLGAGVIPIRAQAGVSAVALTPVEASSSGRGPQARMDTDPQNAGRIQLRDRRDGDSGGNGTGSDTGIAYREDRQRIDDSTLIGPSPAFQANVLELERDLRRAIERLESERSRAEAEAAFKVEKAEAAVEDAEDAKQSAETAAARADLPEISETTTPETADAAPATTGEAEVPEATGTEEAELAS